jgi:NADH-quinone oxidoreductase subunit A
MSEFSIEPYAAIGVTILLVLTVAGGILIVAHAIGPKRHGPVKDSPYESGMPITGDTHRRFSIPFYMVAVLFLLFDVDMLLLWPGALVFHHTATTSETIPMGDGTSVGADFILVGAGIFVALLVFGLLYEWKRGAFEWD